MPKRPSASKFWAKSTPEHSSSQDDRAADHEPGIRRGRHGVTAVGLHLVATPIGNLRDITLRALDTLHQADIIACEDTRVTRKLLTAHNVTTPLTIYHEHNAAKARPALIKRLESGQIVALVSDAGTPLISDPGYRLVREALAAGIAVTVVPGASAPLAALVSSGLPTDRFHFAGYLPSRQAARRTFLAGLAPIDATLLLLDSPHRLSASLADMVAILGHRHAAIARELTKRHEELLRGTLDELARRLAASERLKGEVVLVVGPPEAPAQASNDEIDAALHQALAIMSVRDAAATVAAALETPRRAVYERALELGRRDDDT